MTGNNEHQESAEVAQAAEQPAKVGYAGAERLTGIRRNTLYNLVAQHRIPHHRIGPRFVLFDAADLEQWLAARKVNAK
jgi:excisionase family DNA binding protein